MDRVRHYWNGKWGRLARRDVYVRTDGVTWQVEQRAGGAEGISEFYDRNTEDDARLLVRQLLADGGTWRSLSEENPPRSPSATSGTDDDAI